MNDLSPMNDAVASAYGMTRYLYVDIETIPVQDEAIAAGIRAGVKPPGGMKKAETIALWEANDRPEAEAEAVGKTGLDGAYGHVCTIAWAINDGHVTLAHARSVEDERRVLSEFFAAINPYKTHVIVGHNIAGFDLPFLRKRAVILGVDLPGPQHLPRDPKAWDKNINDTMVMFAGSRDFIGLDRLCQVLGVPGKGGMDGSHVASMWAEGRHDEIAAYCAKDVERTRAVHQRFLAVGW